MLKIFFMLLFVMPLCIIQKYYWMVQNMLFFISFIIMFFWGVGMFYFELMNCLGIDMISYGLIFLSVWIVGLMFMSSAEVYKIKNNLILFLFLILILLFLLILTFSSLNLLMFYIFFESSLIPILLLILGWGYQPERLQAGLYLLFYTLSASLPLLMAIFFLFYKINSLNIFLLKNMNFLGLMLYLAMIFAFLVKMPMFLVHLWLPKAHVEAPISGSMILAGVLLKLGGYGLIRVFSFLSYYGMMYNYWFVSISLMGGMMVSLVCLRQMDMKALIAYSSVAHMGMVLSGVLTLNFWGLGGAYTLMIAHGLCSSGLFSLANMSYERVWSRSMLINKGMMNLIPGLSMWWFLLCAANMAAPPTLNLLGEVSLLNSIISWSWMTIFILAFLSFFSAAYSLYLFSFSQQGKLFSMFYSFSMNSIREYLVLVLHWLPLNLLILKGEICLLYI